MRVHVHTNSLVIKAQDRRQTLIQFEITRSDNKIPDEEIQRVGDGGTFHLSPLRLDANNDSHVCVCVRVCVSHLCCNKHVFAL